MAEMVFFVLRMVFCFYLLSDMCAFYTSLEVLEQLGGPPNSEKLNVVRTPAPKRRQQRKRERIRIGLSLIHI